jgi:hypothetical protein
MIKRIGTGEETPIWNTNWIPRDGLLRPVTCVMDGNTQVPPRRVCDLIDQTTNSWNWELLHDAFLPMDYEIIENIQLSTRRQEDFWAWHYDRKGIFLYDRLTSYWCKRGRKGLRGWMVPQPLQTPGKKRRVGLLCGSLKYPRR